MLIGQKNLLEKLKNLPQVSMLVGEVGSGRHTVAKYVATSILTYQFKEITEEIDDLSLYYESPLNSLYLINIGMLDERKQNTLLKFLEEPPYSSKIILISSYKDFIIPTILNRVQIYYMDNYTLEELREFNKDVDSICTTPGQALEYKKEDIENAKELALKIVKSLSLANYPNTLTIKNKLAIGDNNGIDLDIFFKCLIESLKNNYLETKNYTTYKLFLTTQEYYSKINKNYNLDYLIDNLLSKLWELSRCN